MVDSEIENGQSRTLPRGHEQSMIAVWHKQPAKEPIQVNRNGRSLVMESGATKGAFYISPEHDVFIDGYECGRNFHIENASEIFGANLDDPQRPACHHISAMLTAAIRERVSTLVRARPQGAKRTTSTAEQQVSLGEALMSTFRLSSHAEAY